MFRRNAPCHGLSRLSLNDGMAKGDGGGRSRHFGRLGALGCMTICAIIEHPRCRSRPNDQMKLREYESTARRGTDKGHLGDPIPLQ